MRHKRVYITRTCFPDDLLGEEEVVLRRTERVRREQPKFFHSLELTSGLKRGTKRKQVCDVYFLYFI